MISIIMILQKFCDRGQELRELEEVLESERFELFVLYGRRRIGKTELVLKATEGRRRLYYLAVGERNLERFAAACQRAYPEAAALKADWEALFGFLKGSAEVSPR